MVFRVADNGGGIAPGKLETIFGRFVTEDENPESKGGMGLGLSICRAIVEAHGGSIVARNNDEGGATFEFSLPLRREGADSVSDDAVGAACDGEPAATKGEGEGDAR